MQASAAIGGPARWAQRLTWVTILGVGLGITGPFGSYLNDGPLMRVAYWTGMLWAGAIGLGLTVGPVWRHAPRFGLPRPFAAAAATVVVSGPMAAFAWMVGHLVWPNCVKGLRPLDWYAQTLFLAGLLVAAAIWADRRALAQAASSPVDAGSSDPSGRLPPRLRETALCLEMEDHYVRVHTQAGSELVLAPMRAAVEELGEGRGLQVHRSWWVARAAVACVEPAGRSAVVVTHAGLRVPVARNRLAALRAAGWLPAG